jgi:glycine betaine/proline transport system substrate-binding protein
MKRNVRMKPFFAFLSLIISVSVGTTSAAAQAATADQKQKIILGQVNLSFYAVVGGVVQELLEREGYAVEVVQGPHAEMFPRLGAGQVDIFAAAWLPRGHAALFARVENATFRIAPLYEDARFFWVVPAYVPEGVLSSVSDLVRPDVQQRVSKRIVSLPAETGLTISARRVIDTYNLSEVGYEVVAATPPEWFGTFREAVKRNEWVIFPLWQPHWVNAAYEVRRLDDPKGAYGEPDTAYLLGHRSLRDKLPDAMIDLLSNVRLPIEAVTEMDQMVNVDGLSPRDSAQRWMGRNADVVRSWSVNDK